MLKYIEKKNVTLFCEVYFNTYHDTNGDGHSINLLHNQTFL